MPEEQVSRNDTGVDAPTTRSRTRPALAAGMAALFIASPGVGAAAEKSAAEASVAATLAVAALRAQFADAFTPGAIDWAEPLSSVKLPN